MSKDTRTRMIETTARLVQTRGLHGVSLNDILTASGAPRGSLYFHFPGGKEALVLEAMRAGIDEATYLLRECLATADNPAAGVQSFFLAAAGEMKESKYAFGCPVAPIVLDGPGADSELAAACQAAFDEWMEIYRQALIEGGLKPERAGRLARMIVASLEGALIMARSERTTDCITQVGEELATLISASLKGVKGEIPA